MARPITTAAGGAGPPPPPTTAHLFPAPLLQPHTPSRSDSIDLASSTGSAGSTKGSYKARRARARQQKVNSGRNLRLTAAVQAAPGAVDVCVDVALERVTQRRQPKMMTEEEVARLLARSGDPARAALVPSKAVVSAGAATKESSCPLADDTAQHPRHMVQTISDSTVQALLQRSRRPLHAS